MICVEGRVPGATDSDTTDRREQPGALPYRDIMAAVHHYGRVCRAHAPDEVQEAAHAKVARLVLDAVYPLGGGR
jgi:hypothetical protein